MRRFAGGGGASTGLEAALGRRVDIAINHSPTAIAVHKANHPDTVHLDADIWEVNPRKATQGRPVDVLWASPDCTHFSVAKGDVPRDNGIRSLAWVVVRWARDVRPTAIFVENVGEFQTWGPLGEDGRPNKAKMGQTFKRWCSTLRNLGYEVDYRVLDASLYGAPTRRRRLFIVARRDGQPIRWPEPTHGPGLLPVRTAAECIDWELPCPSIFDRCDCKPSKPNRHGNPRRGGRCAVCGKRRGPLAEKTLWRIAQGIKRFVLESPAPFIVKVNHGGMEARCESIDEPLTTVTAERRGHAVVTPVVAPTMVQTGYGERPWQGPRVLDLDAPLGTVVAGGQKHALVSAFLAKHFGGVVGQTVDQPTSTITAQDHHALAAATLVKFRGSEEQGHSGTADLREPLGTITGGGNHVAEVRAFLTAYYGAEASGQSLKKPARTITAKHRLGLVTVQGSDYQIADIGMRMLEPHELLSAQFGRFAERYDLSAATTKAAKVRLIGNSVCPEVAAAIVAANLRWWADLRITA